MNKQTIAVCLAQAAMLLAALSFFAWIGWQNLVPTGTFTTVWRPGEASAFIDRLLPDARVRDGSTIIGDPAFFFAHPHRRFDTVEAEIRFKNHGANIIEFGGLASSNPEAYTLLPLENQLLDTLSWNKTTGNGLTLWQRVPQYKTIDEFLRARPQSDRVATYQASYSAVVAVAELLPKPREVVLNLRGAHEIKFIAGDGLLALTMSYAQDAANAKPLTLLLSDQNGKPVASRVYTLSAGDTEAQTIRFDIPNLTKGIYKLSWQAPDGIIWHSLTSRLTNVAFLNHLSTTGPMEIIVDAPEFSLKTTVAEGLHPALFDGQSMKMTEPGVAVPVASSRGTGLLSLGNGPMSVDGIGWYAPAPFVPFRPDALRLQATTDLGAQGIDYVLATYAPPSTDGEWKIARLSFDASRLWQQNGTWKFVFSAPKIKEQNASVEIGEIKMVWKRPALFSERSK